MGVGPVTAVRNGEKGAARESKSLRGRIGSKIKGIGSRIRGGGSGAAGEAAAAGDAAAGDAAAADLAGTSLLDAGALDMLPLLIP